MAKLTAIIGIGLAFISFASLASPVYADQSPGRLSDHKQVFYYEVVTGSATSLDLSCSLTALATEYVVFERPATPWTSVISHTETANGFKAPVNPVSHGPPL